MKNTLTYSGIKMSLVHTLRGDLQKLKMSSRGVHWFETNRSSKQFKLVRGKIKVPGQSLSWMAVVS